ncbi:hypothetical protein [Shewanella sp. YLB-07]|uniref:hypothetical protein n=1 Tax=Shewanella sp. YLB-07 TaxID=2601268 RepID=UPI00128B5E23|nr:hypothetical protein [Shewanella sp. YLB-07]MPY24374.1 hypothetical protein [Shewanella sp. YLB-07]
MPRRLYRSQQPNENRFVEPQEQALQEPESAFVMTDFLSSIGYQEGDDNHLPPINPASISSVRPRTTRRRPTTPASVMRPTTGASAAQDVTLPASRRSAKPKVKTKADLLDISQQKANIGCRIQATEDALLYATQALPYGASNLQVDFIKSAGQCVGRVADAHLSWNKEKVWNEEKHQHEYRSRRHAMANTQRIADAAVKYGAGNCVDNAALTFTFLCDLSRQASRSFKWNSSLYQQQASIVAEEMFNASIARVCTTDRLHHYVIIGDWINDPHNSFIVDSWVPISKIGLRFSEVKDFKDVMVLAKKAPFSSTVNSRHGSRFITNPDEMTAPITGVLTRSKPAKPKGMKVMHDMLKGVWGITERETDPSVKYRTIKRAMHADGDDGLNDALSCWEALE